MPLKYFEILRRRGHAPHLLTHARNREDLARFLDTLDNVHFIEDTRAHRLLWQIGNRLPSVFQQSLRGTLMGLLDSVLQRPLIRKLVREEKVDLIHQPTPVSPLAPSGLHRFGVPLVIGPMNGGMTYPPGYNDLESPTARRIIEWSRWIARFVNRLIPGKRKAAVLLVANERTRATLPFPDHPDIRILVENGVDLSVWRMQDSPNPEWKKKFGRHEEPDSPLQLVFMGRLIPLKMVDASLEAVALARAGGLEVTLDILGDGPERAKLEALARRLGLEGAVTFHGFRPQPVCADILRERSSDGALILNSVRECGGAVVLEAMAMTLPVIACDWGGPADYIDAECGLLVSPLPRETFAKRLADAILKLARDPALRRQMGSAARQRVVESFDWEKKVDQICAIYADAIHGNRGTRSRRDVAR